MDPLFKAYGTDAYRERDLSIRHVEEKDIASIAELFRLNYGEAYISPDVYDGTWVKRSIHSDHIICLVLEVNERVLATGSVVLNYGDYNDKSGDLARLVVHPVSTGQGLGRRVVEALFKIAENTLEFAVGECRTANSFSQEIFEESGFSPIGFFPQFAVCKGRRESAVLYAQLHGHCSFLRSAALPAVIPEVASLARVVLSSMGLVGEFTVQNGDPCPNASNYSVRPIDPHVMGPLLRIPHGRFVDPLLFGNISIEQGFTFLRDKASYLVAFDEQQKPIGTIGYRVDKPNGLLKVVELIAESDDVWPSLCRSVVKAGEELGVEVLSVDVSAYQPRLQRLLFEHGFRPVAYAPAMAFHGTERLDVIKMIKLNVPYDPGEMTLTEASRKMFSLVEKNFR